MPRQQRKLSRVPREAFERGEPVKCGQAPDRFHAGVEVER